MVYQWANPEQIGVVTFVGRRVRYIDSGPEYEAAVAAGPLPFAPIQDPAPTPEEIVAILAAWRAGAVISQAQARLTLHQLGLLATVQAFADADPAASIVWEYADVIKRNSPFIDGLGAAAFTPTQIDDIFIYAMALDL